MTYEEASKYCFEYCLECRCTKNEDCDNCMLQDMLIKNDEEDYCEKAKQRVINCGIKVLEQRKSEFCELMDSDW